MICFQLRVSKLLLWLNALLFHYCYSLRFSTRGHNFKVPAKIIDLNLVDHLSETAISSIETFDLKLSMLLAGFAFESYNEDNIIQKKAVGLDKTILTLKSSSFIRSIFPGLLVINLKKGKFDFKDKKNVSTSIKNDVNSTADPYVMIHVESDSQNPYHAFDNHGFRCVDSWVSSCIKTNPKSPNLAEWNESCLLFVPSSLSSTLVLTALDKNQHAMSSSSSSLLFQLGGPSSDEHDDDVIGAGLLTMNEITSLVKDGPVELPIPIFLFNSRVRSDRGEDNIYSGLVAWLSSLIFSNRSSSRSQRREPKFLRTGTLLAEIDYVSWDSLLLLSHQNDSSNNNSNHDNTNHRVNDLISKAVSSTRLSDSNSNNVSILNLSSVPPTITSDVNNNSQVQSQTQKKYKSVIPKGATEHLDWANLIQKISSIIPSINNNSSATTSFTTSSINTTLGDRLIESLQLQQQHMYESDHNTNTSHNSNTSYILSDRPQQSLVNWRLKTGLHHLCDVDNYETDTQASVWVDNQSKQIVIAFRGTEQIKIKDILTDINLVQIPYESRSDNPVLQKDVLCHQGFLTAFKSVRGALLQVLRLILVDDHPYISTANVSHYHHYQSADSCWSIFVTGHSLGGALAALMTFELNRLCSDNLWSTNIDTDKLNSFKLIDRKKIYVPPFASSSSSSSSSSITINSLNNSNNSSNINSDINNINNINITNREQKSSSSSSISSLMTLTEDLPSLYRNDLKFLRVLRKADIHMYSYGAPRVFNTKGAQLFNRLSPYNIFRVVNNKDIVPRMPRSAKINSFFDYEHVGRTVMLDHETLGSLWIQPVKRSAIKNKEKNAINNDEDYKEDSSRSSNASNVFQNVKATFNKLYSRISIATTSTTADKVTSSADEWCPVDDLRPTTDADELVKSMMVSSIWIKNNMPAGISAVTDKTMSLLNQFTESLLQTNTSTTTASSTSTLYKTNSGNTSMESANTSEVDILAVQSLILDSLKVYIDINNNNTNTINDIDSTTIDLGDKIIENSYSVNNYNTPTPTTTLTSTATSGNTDERKVTSDSQQSDTFLDREMQLLLSILDGRALTHHLEPSYYSALEKIINGINTTTTAAAK